jgi:tetratricopeptide (TPR) repeat protein
MDAFISYRRKPSSSLALLLQAKLQANYKIDVYVDTTRTDSTKVQFPERLMEAIVEKRVFICLLGDSTLESEWVIKEIEQAYRYKKHCIPVFQESYVAGNHPSEAVNYLLSFDGVHVMDVKNIYVDEAISQIAQLIRVKPHFNALPYVFGIVLFLTLGFAAFNLYPHLQVSPTAEQTEIAFRPTDTETDRPAAPTIATHRPTTTEKPTVTPTATETPTERPTATSIPFTLPTLEIETAYNYYERGRNSSVSRNYEAAIADFTRAIELDGNYFFSYHGRGDAYYFLHQYEV